METPPATSAFKTNNILLHVLFFISLGLYLRGTNIYKLTVIDTKYLLATVAVGITLIFIVLPSSIATSYPIYWTYFLKASIGGGLFYFGLLFINQQFADTHLQQNNFRIIDAGEAVRAGKVNGPQSYVIVDFYGNEKQLIFYYEFSDADKLAQQVHVTYAKGALGFTVIKSATLSN